MSGDTQVGSIVAYLVLRREDWSAGVRDTERDADRLGRLSPTIRIQTNTGEVIGQLALVHAAERKVGAGAAEAKPFVMNLWAALAAVAPAAVPIAAVAGGAMLGLIPVAATVALGIAGIKNQMKAGALQGSEFATQVDALKSEFKQLQTTAASGLMGGLSQAMQQSQPLFTALNTVIGQTSTELGNIVAGAAPALVSILVQLGPLFATIGNDVAKGAQALERWATSSNGISNFVAYVQAELPQVEHLLGGVITLVGHLLAGAAPAGGGILMLLNGLVTALDAIPVGVLQTAIPLVIALYAAIKAGQGVTAAVNGISAAYAGLTNTLGMTGLKAEAAAAAQTAAALQVQAATAEEAAAVAASQAAMAAAAAEAAVEIAAATEGTTSVLAAGASAAAATAIEEAAAFQAAAEAAAASAAEVSASAEAAAAASATAGAATATAWTAMLGPLAAVGVGVALLATLFMSSSSSVDTGTHSVQAFTSALVDAKGAINSSVRGTIASAIVSHQDLLDLQKFGITTDFMVNSISRAKGTVSPFGDAIERLHKQGKITTAQYDDLIHTMFGLRKGFLASQEAADAQVQAERAQQTAAAGGTAAVRRQAAALHMTSDAYLAAQQSAQKNTDQTNQQTVAFQLENNAAGLLNQALATMAGQNLSVAQAQTSLGQAVHGVIDSMHKNGTAIHGNSVAALSNQQAIEGNVSAARQLATAVATQTGSNDKAAASYKRSKQALEEQLRTHGELTPAVQAYINRLYDVKGISDYLSAHPTKIDVRDEATAKLRAMQKLLNDIANGTYVAHVTATGSVNVSGAGSKGSQYSGHYASGTGSGGLPDGWAWVGDPGPASELVHKRGSQVDVYPHAQSLAIAQQMGMNVPTYASGTKSAKAKGPTSTQLSNVDTTSATLLSAAANMAASASSVRSAATSLDKAALSAGLSLALVASVSADQARLNRDAAKRAGLAARLGTPPASMNPTAYDQLAAAQAAFTSDRDKYRTAMLGFDITSTPPAGPTSSSSQVGGATVTTTTPGSGTVTAASILGAGGADVGLVQEFDSLIHKLVAEGMDPEYVAQIAGKGPQAIDTARALAKATPAQVRALNAQEKQRKAAANDLGTYLAKQYDQAGINAAQGLINGLRSQEKQLTAEMEHIADHMVNTFKHKLGIHSPSVVFDGLGGHSVQGLINGAQRKLHLIRSTSQDMADALMSRFPAGGAGGTAGGQGGGLQVVVNPAANHSEQRIGRAVADEVMWQLRR